MRRRGFIAFLGGSALAWPLRARAQRLERTRRIGVLTSLAISDPEAQLRIAAFRRELESLGWTEGKNLQIDYRSVANRARAYAAELCASAPDVILPIGTRQLSVLAQETRSIPIVFVQVGDPVSLGFVASLARPGGNITGFTEFEFTIGGKWLQAIKEIAPQVDRVMLIFDPTDVVSEAHLRTIEALSPSFGVQFSRASISSAEDVQRNLDTFANGSNAGLIVLPSAMTALHRDLIIRLAAQHRLPAVYPFRNFAASGGLLSYGTNTVDLLRHAASYIDLILKGAKPGELPIQLPTTYELVINLKAANAIGLTVPPTLLARADLVIE